MIIAASLLAADLSRLGHEASRAGNSGADWLHWDIMDGHFVPTLSLGPQAVRAARALTRRPFDLHLLCARPEVLLEELAGAGADHLTVHAELGDRVPGLLWKIRSLGRKAGLALNPPTHVAVIEPHLKLIDQLLILTVNPGWPGQEFIGEVVPKIQQAAEWRRQAGLSFRIAVEGGIDLDSGKECARAGADVFIMGRALFGRRQLKPAVARLREAFAKAVPAPRAVPAATPPPPGLAARLAAPQA